MAYTKAAFQLQLDVPTDAQIWTVYCDGCAILEVRCLSAWFVRAEVQSVTFRQWMKVQGLRSCLLYPLSPLRTFSHLKIISHNVSVIQFPSACMCPSNKCPILSLNVGGRGGIQKNCQAYIMFYCVILYICILLRIYIVLQI